MSKLQSAATLLVLTICSGLPAQEQTVDLPSNPAQWLNSPPISLSAMKGKGAVLYFFEES